MAQFARPSSDVSTTGWVPSSGGDLYAVIDESSANDSDYIRHQYTGGGNHAEVLLSSVTDPISSINHTVRARIKVDFNLASSVPTILVQVALKQGATTIATGSTPNMGDGVWYDVAFTLSGAETDSITNYADLRLRFTVTDGNTDYLFDVSWAEFEVPDITVSGSFSVSDVSTGAIMSICKDKFTQKAHGSPKDYLMDFQDVPNNDWMAKPLKYADPTSEDDAFNGRICSFSGHWFPGHRLVYVNGRPYGDVFAPSDNSSFGIEPETPI